MTGAEAQEIFEQGLRRAGWEPAGHMRFRWERPGLAVVASHGLLSVDGDPEEAILQGRFAVTVHLRQPGRDATEVVLEHGERLRETLAALVEILEHADAEDLGPTVEALAAACPAFLVDKGTLRRLVPRPAAELPEEPEVPERRVLLETRLLDAGWTRVPGQELLQHGALRVQPVRAASFALVAPGLPLLYVAAEERIADVVRVLSAGGALNLEGLLATGARVLVARDGRWVRLTR